MIKRHLSHKLYDYLGLVDLVVVVAVVVAVKVILRPTASRPDCLGVRHPSGTRGQFFPILSLIILDSFSFVDVERPL
jgi:hypothetical protein